MVKLSPVYSAMSAHFSVCLPLLLHSVQVELQSAVHVFRQILQPDFEIQYHQVMITSNISAWEGPCLGCADPGSETNLYYDVIVLLMCSVGRMPSPPPRCLVLAKGVCMCHIVVAGKLRSSLTACCITEGSTVVLL